MIQVSCVVQSVSSRDGLFKIVYLLDHCWHCLYFSVLNSNDNSVESAVLLKTTNCYNHDDMYNEKRQLRCLYMGEMQLASDF